MPGTVLVTGDDGESIPFTSFCPKYFRVQWGRQVINNKYPVIITPVVPWNLEMECLSLLKKAQHG